MNRNRANCQHTAWTAEQMVALQRRFDYLLESVSCDRANELEKRQKKFRKNQQ